ncbi:hypothetical protein FACS189413_09070 [Bacteroidia bacterium]|nr:hypothetical protein FACS189463_0320 [Bacteroidia bacterium]GHU69730.1 hypothetical protein FACS189413_09070 [Bacteroidia bacterium]
MKKMKNKKFIFKQIVALIFILASSLSPLNAQTIALNDGSGAITIAAAGELATAINALGDKTALTSLAVSSTTSAGNVVNATDVAALQTLTALETLDFSGFTANPCDLPAGLLWHNRSVKNFVFPLNTRNIGNQAFTDCVLEGEIILPKTVANGQVSRTTFGNSQKITGFSVEEGSTQIKTIDGVVFNYAGNELFFYPSGKTDVSYTISAGVGVRNGAPFSYNSHLKKLTFSGRSYIQNANGFDLVANHSHIDSVFVAADHTDWTSIGGLLCNKSNKGLLWITKGRIPEVRVSEGIEIIENASNTLFSGSRDCAADSYYENGVQLTTSGYVNSVTLIDLPASLVEIKTNAFLNLLNLQTVIFRSESVPVFGANAFNNSGYNLSPAWSVKVYVPNGKEDTYKSNTSFTSNSKLQAQYVSAFYTVGVTNGTASSPLAADIAAAGQTVNLSAGTVTGQTFKEWTSTPGVVFADKEDPNTSFVMPSDNVSVTAVFQPVGTLYPYTITGATVTQSGETSEGSTVPLETALRKGDNNEYLFQYWQATSGNVTIASLTSTTTSFQMIAAPVTIEAVYALDATAYPIAIAGGTATVNELPVTEAYQGDVVTITAIIPEGKAFDGWSAEGVTLTNAATATTTFAMPANAVTITANIVDFVNSIVLTTAKPTLSDYPIDRANVTELTVSSDGKEMPAADFVALNTQFPKLKTLNIAGLSNLSIPDNAFKDNKIIRHIDLPAGLTTLGGAAFANSVLEGIVTLPKSLNIAQINSSFNGRFENCPFITGFAIEDNTETAGNAGLKAIEGVLFSKDGTILALYPAGKTGESYTVPEGVTTLHLGSLTYLAYLKNITLASTLISNPIPADRWSEVTKLSSIENIFVAEGNTRFASSQGSLYEIDNKTLRLIPPAKAHLVVGEPVEIVSNSYLINTTLTLQFIDLPATLTTLQQNVFNGANNVDTLIVRSITPPSIDTNTLNAFGWRGTGDHTTVYVPVTALTTYLESNWNRANNTNNFPRAFAESQYAGFYQLTVNDGTAASPLGFDIAAAGQTVTVTAAEAPEGQVFSEWTAEPPVSFDNSTSANTHFVMPASNVTLTANYSPLTAIENPVIAVDTPYVIYNLSGIAVERGMTKNSTLSTSNLAKGVYIFKTAGKAIRFIQK